ncbi:MAG: hypothetical protein ACI9U0_001137 [Flavobacteriales bacterium]
MYTRCVDRLNEIWVIKGMNIYTLCVLFLIDVDN